MIIRYVDTSHLCLVYEILFGLNHIECQTLGGINVNFKMPLNAVIAF